VVAEEPKGGILNRGYEWYPVVGLGLAAAVTQEVCSRALSLSLALSTAMHLSSVRWLIAFLLASLVWCWWMWRGAALCVRWRCGWRRHGTARQWLIVDEYWVTSFAYGTVMYAAYVLGHDKILASGKEAFAKQTACVSPHPPPDPSTPTPTPTRTLIHSPPVSACSQTKAAFGIRLDNLKRYKALEEFSRT
jgi:hypothetical protein